MAGLAPPAPAPKRRTAASPAPETSVVPEPGVAVAGAGLPRFLRAAYRGATAAAGDESGREELWQAKLSVSRSDDPLERQADRIADQVTTSRSRQIQRKCAGCGDGKEPCPACAEEEEEEAERASRAVVERRPRVVQRKGVDGEGSSVACPECAAEEEEVLSRRADASAASPAPSAAQALQTLEGKAGDPLDEALRVWLERRFGYGLAGVRIHRDARADLAARALRALAFTRGQNVYFAAGRYAPDTAEGLRLIAHELVHTIQQTPPGQRRAERVVPAPRGTGDARGTGPAVTPAGPAPGAPIQRTEDEVDESEAERLADEIYDALDGINNVERALAALGGHEAGMREAIQSAFQREHEQALSEYLKAQLEGDDLVNATALLSSSNFHEQHTAMARALIPLGTRDEEIGRILYGLSLEGRQQLERYYDEAFAGIGEGSLKADLRDDLSGWRLEKSLALLDRDLTSADELYFDSVGISGTHTDAVVKRIQDEWANGPGTFAALEHDWDQYVRNQKHWTDTAWTEMTLYEAMDDELSGEEWELVEAVLQGYQRVAELGTEVTDVAGPGETALTEGTVTAPPPAGGVPATPDPAALPGAPPAGPGRTAPNEETLLAVENAYLEAAERSITAATTGGYTGAGTTEAQVDRAVETMRRIWERRIKRARDAGDDERARRHEDAWKTRRRELLASLPEEMDTDTVEFRRVRLILHGDLTPADQLYLAKEDLDSDKVLRLATAFWAQGAADRLLEQAAEPRRDDEGTVIRPSFNPLFVVPVTSGIMFERVQSMLRPDVDNVTRGVIRLRLEIDEGDSDSDLQKAYEFLTTAGISGELRNGVVAGYAADACGAYEGETATDQFLAFLGARYENSNAVWQFTDLLRPTTDPQELVNRARGRLEASRSGVLNVALDDLVRDYDLVTGEDTAAVTEESLARLEFIARTHEARPEELLAMMAIAGVTTPDELAATEYTLFRRRLDEVRSLKRSIAEALATAVELAVEAALTVATGGAAGPALLASLSAAVAGMVARELLLGQDYNLVSKENAERLVIAAASHGLGAISRAHVAEVLTPERLRALGKAAPFVRAAAAEGMTQVALQPLTLAFSNRFPTAEDLSASALVIVGSSVGAGLRGSIQARLAEDAPAVARLRNTVLAHVTANVVTGVSEEGAALGRSGVGDLTWTDVTGRMVAKTGTAIGRGLVSGVAEFGGETVAAGRRRGVGAEPEEDDPTGTRRAAAAGPGEEAGTPEVVKVVPVGDTGHALTVVRRPDGSVTVILCSITCAQVRTWLNTLSTEHGLPASEHLRALDDVEARLAADPRDREALSDLDELADSVQGLLRRAAPPTAGPAAPAGPTVDALVEGGFTGSAKTDYDELMGLYQRYRDGGGTADLTGWAPLARGRARVLLDRLLGRGWVERSRGRRGEVYVPPEAVRAHLDELPDYPDPAGRPPPIPRGEGVTLGPSVGRETTGEAMRARFLSEATPAQLAALRRQIDASGMPAAEVRDASGNVVGHWPVDATGMPYEVNHRLPLEWGGSDTPTNWEAIPHRDHEAITAWWNRLRWKVLGEEEARRAYREGETGTAPAPADVGRSRGPRRRKPEGGSAASPEEREADDIAAAVVEGRGAVRHAAGTPAVAELPASSDLPGPGRPLDPRPRAVLEPHLGADLAAVRVHTDAAAAAQARSLGAQAFAQGRDIAFAAGRYAPESDDGLRLLAHEVTHVVRHEAAPGAIRRKPDEGATVASPQGGATEEVRAAMSEGNPIAGVGNFPKAFGILDALTMPDLLSTLGALESWEFENLVWNIGSAAQFRVPRLQAAIDAVRLAHDQSEITVDDVVNRFSQALADDELTDVINYVMGVKFTGLGHETAALSEASRFTPTGTTRQDILQQMDLIGRNLVSADADAAWLGITSRLEPVRNAVEKRLQKLRASEDPGEVRKWGTQAAAQFDIARRSAWGLAFAREQVEGVAKTMGPGVGVPDYVRGPVVRMAETYVAAARSSELVATGYAMLAAADRRAEALQVDIMEGILDETDRLFAQAKAASHGRTDLTGLLQRQYREDLAKARELLATDPAQAVEWIKHMQEHVRELQEMAIVTNTRVQFDALLEHMHDVMWDCVNQHLGDEVRDLAALREELRPYRDHWWTLEEAYRPPIKSQQDAAWAVIKAESQALSDLLGRITAKVEYAEKRVRRRQLIARIIILSLIALATLGVGVYLTGIAAGLELGAGGTFLLVSGGEALYFTAATSLLLERDPSLTKTLEQFFVNWITFGAMRGASALYRAVLGTAAKTIPGVASEAILLLGAQSAVSLSLADRQKRQLTGQGLTESEAAEIVAEGVIVGMVAMVGGRVGKDLLPEIQASGFKAGRRLAVINAMRRRLAARCAALVGKPTASLDLTSAAQPPQSAESGAPRPKNIEAARQVLEEDAALIRQEGEVLKQLDLEVGKDPTSPEAQQVKAEIAANAEAAQKNEALQIASLLESAGPNQVLCEQGRLEQVEAYHRRNDRVTVTKGTDADGARTITVTPNDPADGAPFRIIEKTAPGADPVITKAPEPVGAAETPPVESKHKAFSDLLTEDGMAFRDAKFEEAYQRYLGRKAKEKKSAKTREEWARSQTTRAYRQPLEAELGPDFFKQGRAKIAIRDKARPRDYTPERYLADEAAARPHVGKVLKAAGVDPVTGIPGGEISVAAFNGAKGVVAEILARGAQADVLAGVRQQYPDAVIMRGLRMRLMRGGKLGPPKQFTDAVVGFFDGKDLKLVGRFEVKSGPTGGQEATVQFFEWVEGRLESGSELLVPGRDPVVYKPLPAQRAAGVGTVSGLANARTYIVAPKGAEQLGRGSAMQTVTSHERIALDTTASEIEFVTRLLLEPYIRPSGPTVR